MHVRAKESPVQPLINLRGKRSPPWLAPNWSLLRLNDLKIEGERSSDKGTKQTTPKKRKNAPTVSVSLKLKYERELKTRQKKHTRGPLKVGEVNPKSPPCIPYEKKGKREEAGRPPRHITSQKTFSLDGGDKEQKKIIKISL